MIRSFNQFFESIRSSIPGPTEGVILYRRKRYSREPGAHPSTTQTHYEIAFAFHTQARVAQNFFDGTERNARRSESDCVAAVVYVRSPDLRAAWMVADAFDLEDR